MFVRLVVSEEFITHEQIELCFIVYILASTSSWRYKPPNEIQSEVVINHAHTNVFTPSSFGRLTTDRINLCIIVRPAGSAGVARQGYQSVV